MATTSTVPFGSRRRASRVYSHVMVGLSSSHFTSYWQHAAILEEGKKERVPLSFGSVGLAG